MDSYNVTSKHKRMVKENLSGNSVAFSIAKEKGIMPSLFMAACLAFP
jgi:hypothetical protein